MLLRLLPLPGALLAALGRCYSVSAPLSTYCVLDTVLDLMGEERQLISDRCLWLTSLSVIISRSTHVIANDMIPFFFMGNDFFELHIEKSCLTCLFIPLFSSYVVGLAFSLWSPGFWLKIYSLKGELWVRPWS